MMKRKNADDRPIPAPEPEPEPESTPEPEPTSSCDEVAPDREVTIPADALENLQVAFIERGISLSARDREIEELRALVARQAGELSVASENAELLQKSRDSVGSHKLRWARAKEDSTAAKKGYEAALEAHLDLERELLSGQQRLPFPPPEAPDAPDAPAATAVATPALPSVDAAAAGDESWRPTPLGTLGIADELPHAILARLEDAGIVTVGDLADFVRPGPSGHCKRLVDIDGIGEAKAERIEAALDAFWEKWSEWQARQEAAAAEGGEVIEPGFVEIEGEGTDPFSSPSEYDLEADGDDDDDQDGEDGEEAA